MKNLNEILKSLESGEKTIVMPENTSSFDLEKLADCLNGYSGITLDLRKTSIEEILAYTFGTKFIGSTADFSKIENFVQCTSLKSVILPETLKSIGKMAFFDCSNLESIILSEGLTTIKTEAFCSCRNLKSITFPDSVINIEDHAFASCNNLESINIPSSVRKIEKGAFLFCVKLKSIVFQDSANWYTDSEYRASVSANELPVKIRKGIAIYKKTI